MGSKNQTTTSQSSTTPTNQAGLQSIYNQVQSAASNPYTPYGGQLTAGINSQQQQGIAGINSAAGSAQPYYQQAAQYAQSGASAIDPSQIARYSNPYTQSVIDATQANFNESNGQQQQQVMGNAALSGALGGSRQAVAQAETTRQQQLAQAPVIAGLNQQNYTQALQAAQADRSAQQYGAGAFAGIGSGAQTAALQGAGAQLGAGTQEQQTTQAGLNAQYQQYLQQQAFPYQQAQFYAQYGTPAALAQGSTTNGTSTAPGPNPLVQAAGLGLSAAAAFSDERVKEGKEVIGKTFDGQPIYKFRYIGNPMTQIGLMAQDVEHKHPGAVGERDGIKTVDYDQATADSADRGRFAGGGQVSGGASPFNFITDAQGYIPVGGSAPQVSLPQSQAPQSKASGNPADPLAPIMSGLGAMKGKFGGEEYGGGNIFTAPSGGSSSNPLAGLSKEDYGEGYEVGGLVEAIHSIHKTIKRSRGGSVVDVPFAGYAKGGKVRRFADGGDTSFDDRFSAAFSPRDPEPSDEPFRMAGPEATDAWRKSVGNPAEIADAGAPPAPQAVPAPANPIRVALPKQITGPAPEEEEPTSALAYDTPAKNPMTSAAAPQAPAVPSPNGMGGFNPLNLSDKLRQSLIAGGLGVAASRSPFALSAIGEGGLHGLKSYSEATAAEQAAADKKISQGQQERRVNMEAQRIAQSAEQFAKTNKLAERRQTFAEDKTPEGYRAKRDGEGYEPIPGGPADPEMLRKVAEAKRAPGQSMDDETAEFLAERVLAGDTKALVGLGRGAQGAENIAKIQSLAVKKAKEQGIDAKGVLRNIAEQAYNVSGARALGTKSVHFGTAEKAMEESLPIARAASAAVPRTQWKMLTELIQKGQTQINDPKLKQFLIATDTAAKDYARTINPSGTLRESDIAYARKILSTADSGEAYSAALDQLQIEAGVMRRALARQKDEILSGGKGGHAEPAPAAPAAKTATAVKPATVTQNGHTYALQPDGSYK